jgi:aminotransferase
MNFSRAKNINLSPIKTIELLASKIPDVVSLAQGIPSFDTPEVVKKAAIKALNRGVVARYSLTYGLPELRETIEQKLAEQGMYYDFEKEIIATAGSIEAITAALISIIDNRRNEVVLFSPSYTSYAEAVKVAGGKPVFVNLAESRGWRIDFKNVKRRITSRTAAILFCNPNNPTGTIFPREDLLKIAELAAKKDVFILSDEVYKDFVYDSDTKLQTHPNLQTDDFVDSNKFVVSNRFFSMAQVPQLRKMVIRIFSLSKVYAMTGWRIGFLHSDEENIKEIVKVHDALVTCAPVISQYAALAALDFGDEEIKKFRDEFAKRRDLICRHLDELQRCFSYQKPEGAYFVFPKIAAKLTRDLTQNRREISPSWRFALDLLKKARVAVVPGIAFGPSGEGHIRMSFGRSEKDINEAFKRIKEYFL